MAQAERLRAFCWGQHYPQSRTQASTAAPQSSSHCLAGVTETAPAWGRHTREDPERGAWPSPPPRRLSYKGHCGPLGHHGEATFPSAHSDNCRPNKSSNSSPH